MTSIGVAIATLRADPCCNLVRALLEDERPDAISVAFQGDLGQYASLHRALTEVASCHDYRFLSVVYDSKRGASRARNVAIASLPPHIDWLWTPNDTSLPPSGWLTAFTRTIEANSDDLAIVSGQYVTGGFIRRDPPDDAAAGWKIWSLLEAATLWHRQSVLDAGGFDERIGTGSPGLAQSGEGTDLMARLIALGGTLAVAPVAIVGPHQSHGLDPRSAAKKEFYYAVGFGVVARRHFGVWRVLLRLPGPIVKSFLRLRSEGEATPLRTALVRTAGRLVGLVLGERATHLRRR